MNISVRDAREAIKAKDSVRDITADEWSFILDEADRIGDDATCERFKLKGSTLRMRRHRAGRSRSPIQLTPSAQRRLEARTLRVQQLRRAAVENMSVIAYLSTRQIVEEHGLIDAKDAKDLMTTAAIAIDKLRLELGESQGKMTHEVELSYDVARARLMELTGAKDDNELDDILTRRVKAVELIPGKLAAPSNGAEQPKPVEVEAQP